MGTVLTDSNKLIRTVPADFKDDTWWRCAVEKNEKGNYTWVAAEMIE